MFPWISPKLVYWVSFTGSWASKLFYVSRSYFDKRNNETLYSKMLLLISTIMIFANSIIIVLGSNVHSRLHHPYQWWQTNQLGCSDDGKEIAITLLCYDNS